MILNPAIIALLLGSAVTAVMLLYAAGIGVQVLRGWDRSSGSEGQLLLERKTSLVSTILGYLLGFQLLSLLLFIHTADVLHILFTGAMCAAGTLNVNGYGYPALLLKLVNTLVAGLWLVVNHADSRGYDFPLVRPRYGALLIMAPLACAEALLLTLYFLGLKADVITSCCGSLFGGDQGTFAGGVASLPPLPTVVVFYLLVAAVLAAGLRVWLQGRGDLQLGIVTLVFLAVALAALISVFSLYYYEIPTHHCPFCLLQQEYDGIGYLLYGLLLAGGISGIGCGLLHSARTIPSLRLVVPPLQRRLALAAAVATALFTLLVTWRLAVSPFLLQW